MQARRWLVAIVAAVVEPVAIQLAGYAPVVLAEKVRSGETI